MQPKWPLGNIHFEGHDGQNRGHQGPSDSDQKGNKVILINYVIHKLLIFLTGTFSIQIDPFRIHFHTEILY